MDEASPKAILTAPLSIEGGSESKYRAPNLLQRILSLFRNLLPGSDLTTFQLPPLFNIPKSQLQCYGESLYCNSDDILGRCVNSESSLERFTSVVAWHLSTFRPLMFGVAPYNPTLGETHHVTCGNLNVLLEQVSHNPPVSALYATDEDNSIETIWCHCLRPKFNGTSVETEVAGKRVLRLLKREETYLMSCPKLAISFFPVPSVEWFGNVTVCCPQTGLQAELSYRGNSFLGFGGNRRSIKGKILSSSSLTTIYAINGHWDRTVTMKDISSGKVSVLYNASKALSGLKTPIVKNPKGVTQSESAVVWAKVSKSILDKCWDKAREAKTAVEERERELVKERKLNGETWVPKYFSVSLTKENEWDCLPNQKHVPPAPIIVPI